MRLTLAEIGDVTGGTVVGDPATAVDSFSIDSRTMTRGGLFVAVRAERDGHEFVGDAFVRGASAALVERTPADLSVMASELLDRETDPAVVVVDDTVDALARLGAHARDRLSDDVRVIGITGSTGKTSTKDLTAAALGAHWSVCASAASFNNELGVPLTLLAVDAETGAVVAEIGARGHGHVESLAAIVRPSIGIVTTVGEAHTETFGSVEDVARAKSELLAALPAHGMAIIGTDHPHVDTLRSATAAGLLTVGRAVDDDVRVSDIRVDDVLRPTFVFQSPWGERTITLEVRGAHQTVNAALALTAAMVAGADLDAVVAAISVATGSRWRMDIDRSPSGIIVINDAYNANPTSMEAALDALAALDIEGRRWAVLGEMAELGPSSASAHRRVGELVAERSIERLVVVGDVAAPIADAAREAGVDVRSVASSDGVLAALADAGSGDAVLVKASRVAGLERIADALLAGAPGRQGVSG